MTPKIKPTKRKSRWYTLKEVEPDCTPEDMIEMELDDGTICTGYYEDGHFRVQSFLRVLTVDWKLVQWRFLGKQWSLN